MLDPKPTVYLVYVKGESNGCVPQLLQLLILNETSFSDNSVVSYTNIKSGKFLKRAWCRNCICRSCVGELVINLSTLHDYVQTEWSNLSSSYRNG